MNLFLNQQFNWETHAISSLNEYKNLIKVASMLYLPVIFALKSLKLKFKLNYTFMLWNSFLALFSIIGTIILGSGLIKKLYENGVDYTICNNDYQNNSLLSRFVYYFIISKLYELGDTIFICLKDGQLIFLHWWHHIVTLLYAWESGLLTRSSGLYFSAINYCIHSIMYSYYAIYTYTKIFPGKKLNLVLGLILKHKKLITVLQILQMFIGLYVSLIYSTNCDKEVDYMGIVMYGIYFILFVKHFINMIYKSKNS